MITKNLVPAARQMMFASIALVAGLLCTLSADATTPANDVASVTIKYGDLDLSTATGVHRLYRRIVAAAEQVCPDDTTPELQIRLLARACRADAVARAVRSVNNSQLAALYEQSARHG